MQLRLLLAVSISIALLLPALAAAEQIPLRADVGHGIVVWTGNKLIYKNNQPTWDNWLRVYIGPDDVQRIKEWGQAYVVVRVIGVDPYLGRPPLIRIHVLSGEPSVGNELYASDWVDVPNPGVYEFPIPSWVVQSLPDGGFRLGIELFPWWDTANQSDHIYGVRIAQVILAPPQGTADAQQPVQEQPMAGQWHGFDAKTVAIAAAGGLVLGVVLMQVAGRRR